MLSADPPTTLRPRKVKLMRRAKKRGPGPSSVLLTLDHAGNVVGIDPLLARHQPVSVTRQEARCLAHATAMTSGVIRFRGEDITTAGRRGLQPVRRQVQMVFRECSKPAASQAAEASIANPWLQRQGARR